MAFNVGSGASLQLGKEVTFGTAVTPTVAVDFTSESIKVSVEKGGAETLIAAKTKMADDLLAINVDGSVSMVLRPETSGMLFKAALGGTDTVTQDTTDTTLYHHTMVLAGVSADLPSLTAVVDRKSSVKKYVGLTVSALTLDCAAGDYVKATVDFKGTNEANGSLASGVGLTIPAYKCTQATFKVGNVVHDVSSVSWKIDNAIEDAPKTYSSGLYRGQPQHGTRAVTMTFEIPASAATDTLKDTYLTTETNASLELYFTSTSSDYNIKITMPNVAFTDAGHNVNGAGLLTASFSGEALSIYESNAWVEPCTVVITDKTTTAY